MVVAVAVGASFVGVAGVLCAVAAVMVDVGAVAVAGGAGWVGVATADALGDGPTPEVGVSVGLAAGSSLPPAGPEQAVNTPIAIATQTTATKARNHHRRAPGGELRCRFSACTSVADTLPFPQPDLHQAKDSCADRECQT
jgi:hypothetical protein